VDKAHLASPLHVFLRKSSRPDPFRYRL
jgi:hypothetical protein